MVRALSVAARAFRLWWQEIYLLIFFNLVWLTCQVLIVPGPPATAAMYLIARRVADDELLELRHGWEALRQMFLPAWKWGAVNLLMLIVLGTNFVGYRMQTGLGWTMLRMVWGTIALAWFAMNLFYWPFWLAQSDRRLLTTYRNSALMLMKKPALGMTLMLVSALVILISVAVTLPFAAALMTWLALLGVLAVDEALRPDAAP